MRMPTIARPRAWILCAAAWLACAAPAFANGSLSCAGRPYAVEVQFSLSTGELTQLIVAREQHGELSSERFAPRHRSIDYTRRTVQASGTSVDRPSRTATLRIADARGTLTLAGQRHRLRCDWNGLG
jgi:hypothetical protein